MSEFQPRVESEQDNRRNAYESFVRLAEIYGHGSKDGGATFYKSIPAGSKKYDKISGRYFGVDTRRVDMFFRKGIDAGQITLVKDELGVVSLTQVALFRHVDAGEGKLPSLIPNPDASFDASVVNGLLTNAERICVAQKRKRDERLVNARMYIASSMEALRLKKEETDKARERSEEHRRQDRIKERNSRNK